MRDLRDFSSQIAKDTKEAWDRQTRPVIGHEGCVSKELQQDENSERVQLSQIINDDMTFICDPQGDRALAEYANFEPSQSDIATLMSQKIVQDRFDQLVPNLVPSEKLFWKRLMYKLHLLRMESVTALSDLRDDLKPEEIDEESVHWE